MVDIHSLPTEVIDSIARYLPQVDLFALSLSSRWLNPSALDMLCRSISVDTNDRIGATLFEDTSRLRSLLCTLLKYPERAERILKAEFLVGKGKLELSGYDLRRSPQEPYRFAFLKTGALEPRVDQDDGNFDFDQYLIERDGPLITMQNELFIQAIHSLPLAQATKEMLITGILHDDIAALQALSFSQLPQLASLRIELAEDHSCLACFIEDVTTSHKASICKFSALQHIEIRPATSWSCYTSDTVYLPIGLLPSLRTIKAHTIMPSFAGPAQYQTLTSLHLNAWVCPESHLYFHDSITHYEDRSLLDAITDCPNLETLELTEFGPCRLLAFSLFEKMKFCQDSLKSLTTIRNTTGRLGTPLEDWHDASYFPTGLEKFAQLTNLDIDCHKFLWHISNGQAGILPPSIERVQIRNIVRVDRTPFLLWLEYISHAGNLPNLRQITYSFYQDEDPSQYAYNNYLSMPKETIRNIEACGIQITRLFAPTEQAATPEQGLPPNPDPVPPASFFKQAQDGAMALV